jgi:hypothetical protein
MTMIATAAHSSWRSTKCQLDPGRGSMGDMMEEAL